MHKLTYTFFILVIFIIGCSIQDLSKKDYYEKGREFLKSGNSNGAIVALKKAIEKDQNYFEARFQLALAYILHSKYEKAERELKKVLRLNPSYDEARLSLAKIYVNASRSDEAIVEISNYIKGKEDNPEAYEIMASAYAGKEDFAAAERTLNDTLERFPNSNSTKIGLANTYIANGKPEKAEKMLQDVLEKEKNNIKALHLLARIKKQQNNIDEVIDIYRKILDEDNDDINTKFELGLSYLLYKKYDEAENIAIDLKTNYKKRPEGLYLMGMVHYSVKEVDEAIVSFKEALKIASIPQANYYLGLSLLLKEDLEQATREFQRAVEQNPEMIQARLLLALTHLKKGRPEAAEREAQRALETDQKNAFAHNILGSAYLALGKGDMAMEEFDRAIELNPGLVDAYMKKGALNLLSGKEDKAEEEFLSAVENSPDMLNARVILARYYFKTKRFNDAIKTLNGGLKEKPGDAIIYNIMGAAYLGAEDLKNAVLNFNKAIEAKPDFSLPYFNLALLHLKAGNKEKAVTEYNRVLKFENNNVRALLMLAKIMEEDKKEKEALSYYIKAKNQGDPVAHMSLAAYYQKRNESRKAIRVLDEALKSDSKNTKVMEMKGRIYIAMNNHDKAFSEFRKIAKISPIPGTERIAELYSLMGDYESAIRELKGLSLEGPDRIKVLMQIVNLYLKKKDYKAAESTSEKIISMAPESDIGYVTVSRVYFTTREFTKALDTLKKAEKINPDNLKTKISIGNAYVQMKDYEKALETFNKLADLNPEHAPVYFFQANTLELMGKRKEAIEKHKKALAISPDYAPSLNNLAYLYAEGFGPIEKAVDMAQRAKQIAPKNGSITDTLGWFFYKSGDYDEAITYFKEAIHYLPEQPTIRYHLGLAYLKKGMDSGAEEQLKSALVLGRRNDFPESEHAERILEEISQQ